jgi:hypothetical protein
VATGGDIDDIAPIARKQPERGALGLRQIPAGKFWTRI